ncbi:MAG: PepSY domain-containing protein [Sphingomicrobium sp.]
MRSLSTLTRALLAAAILAGGGFAVPASADPDRDADRAFEATREGRSMPLPQLERRILPFMGGADYLGPELNGGTYRLKFMQGGRVIWVDVDARTGRVIRRSRP